MTTKGEFDGILESLPSISYSCEVAISSLLASKLCTALITPCTEHYRGIIEVMADLGMEESEFLTQC